LTLQNRASEEELHRRIATGSRDVDDFRQLASLLTDAGETGPCEPGRAADHQRFTVDPQSARRCYQDVLEAPDATEEERASARRTLRALKA